MSRCVHAALPGCPSHISPAARNSDGWLEQNLIYTSRNKSHAWGWALPQAESHQGWLLDTIFIPDTQSLQQSSLHGSVPAVVPRLVMAEAFCLCPSSTALAGQSPAIFLCTFSSRQQDPAFQCHGIPLKMRVMVQLCSTSQGRLIQILQKSSHFNYLATMGENSTYWSYGDSSLPPASPAVYRGEWAHKDVGQVNDLTLTWLWVLYRWWDLACEAWLWFREYKSPSFLKNQAGEGGRGSLHTSIHVYAYIQTHMHAHTCLCFKTRPE